MVSVGPDARRDYHSVAMAGAAKTGSASHRPYHGFNGAGPKRALPRIKGHEAGAQAVRECVEGLR